MKTLIAVILISLLYNSALIADEIKKGMVSGTAYSQGLAADQRKTGIAAEKVILKNAVIYIYQGTDVEPLRITQADPQGKFKIELPEGSYTLLIEGTTPNEERISQEVDIVAGLNVNYNVLEMRSRRKFRTAMY